LIMCISTIALVNFLITLKKTKNNGSK
jgi:hypothetical protein